MGLKKSVDVSSEKDSKSKNAKNGNQHRSIKHKYSFQPVNSLEANRNERNDRYEVKELEKSSLHHEKTLVELQSSDDSFEGIKWRTSPKMVNRNTISSNLGSSPLRTVNTRPQAFPANDSSSTLSNEQADFVLSKYGSKFMTASISQTPTMKKAVSEIPISFLRNHANSNSDAESSLPRAKSMRIEQSMNNEANKSKAENVDHTKITEKSNRLSKWIELFDDSKRKTEALKPESTLSKKSNFEDLDTSSKDSDIRAELVTPQMLQSIDFSDDFSDSKILNSGNDVDADEAESDPFSSDDEILTSILQTDMNDHVFSEKHKSNNLVTGHRKPIVSDAHLPSALHSFHTTNSPRFDKSEPTDQKAKNNRPEAFIQQKYSSNDIALSFNRKELQRYMIVNIIHNKYKAEGRHRNQLIIELIDSSSKRKKIIVRGEYLGLDFQMGDIIHLILTNPSNQNLVDDQNNLLIWNPDILVSATTVSQQLSCPRKSVLLDRYSFPGESSLPLITGVIIHEIFQSCILNERWDFDFMREILREELERHTLEIYSIGDVLNKVESEVNEQLVYLEQWFRKYYKQKHLLDISTNPQKSCIPKLTINNAVDVEENIWSPMYGIKGKIDVTINALSKEKTNKKSCLVPMEIKTGREYLSHKVQSSLYSLLLRDKYNIDSSIFLLVYTKERISQLHSVGQLELKSLVNLRNRITKYLKPEVSELPPIMKQTQCDRCEVQEPCMLLNKLFENGNSELAGLKEGTYEQLTSHLLEGNNMQIFSDFYLKWDRLISKEEGLIRSFKKHLWTMTSRERETLTGKAIGGLILISKDENLLRGEFRYTLKRSLNENMSIQRSQISKHDRIILSEESGHFAIAQGFVETVRPAYVVIMTYKKLVISNTANNSSNASKSSVDSSMAEETLFRIDLDDMFHGMATARFNILNLILKNGDVRRRELIVKLKAPQFSENTLSYTLPNSFNVDQRFAIEKALSADDYALILGMPGTGKTTVIATLIKILTENKKSVLLASYTHSAVDNILLKLLELDVKFLRVGSHSRMHNDIKNYSLKNSHQINDYNSFLRSYIEPDVIATTCLGINDVTFNLRSKFDYCIIDEASQVSMPICVGPLRFADKFILVGDHHQLPPLVRNTDPDVKHGLEQSLFKLLCETHPCSVAQLTYQYRMSQDIMSLSNKFVYDGNLKVGNDSVASKSLSIQNLEKLDQHLNLSGSFEPQKWLHDILNGKSTVIFLDHDNVPAQESRLGERIENGIEANFVSQIVSALTLLGVAEKEIGIISPYRSQLKVIHRMLQRYSDVEIRTPDQFQGRDKDCIILSLVRSNSEYRIGELLRDWRRINVAITRAKCKLIILGSRSTFENTETLGQLIGLFAENEWIYELGSSSKKAYIFEDEISSQRSSHPISVNSKVIDKSIIIKDILNNYK